MRRVRQLVVILLCIGLASTGCSRAVEIPRADVEKPEYREPGAYRIYLKDQNEYIVRQFSATDSTVVIEELHGSDKRLGDVTLPIVIPMTDIESVARLETHQGKTLGFVALLAIVGVAIAALATWDLPATD
jgi:hypothetical protein